jgi:hypothetical protein
MPVHLDEYPIHQAPLSLRHVTSSDRNAYDRAYFNAHDRTGEVFLVTGCGVYPNLGVRDAFAALRVGDRQWTVRTSDSYDEPSLNQRVGPYSLEVVEPLQRIHLCCDPGNTPDGLGFDLTWTGSFPAVDEQPHLMRVGARPILDAQRFAQTGVWEGRIEVDGRTVEVDPDTWVGTRDRSWGIRPVGEADPGGRSAEEPIEGFWWLYLPFRFDDFQLIVICQELPDGFRTLNDAVRVFADGRIEQLGWPRIRIDYAPGTRRATAASLELCTPDGEPLQLEIESLGRIALAVGCGYGGDQEWTHGQWRGRDWTERTIYDLSDPSVTVMEPFSVVDHVGRATLTDAHGRMLEGWGLFEHGCFGRHDPSGFTGYDSVA